MRFIMLPAGLLAAIVAVFLLVPNAIIWFAFSGKSFLAGELWRIFTYPFVHYNVEHLIENALALVVVSLLAYEIEMTAWQYVLAFTASWLLVAAVDTVLFPAIVIVGASAAIYAVYGSFAMKGSSFIHRSWLVVIIGLTVCLRLLFNILTGSGANDVPLDVALQTVLHLFGFAVGICMMVMCVEIGKATKQKVFT